MSLDFDVLPFAQDFPIGGALVCIGAPILLVLIWVAVTFNRLINLRNLIKNSWSNVDTEYFEIEDTRHREAVQVNLN